MSFDSSPILWHRWNDPDEIAVLAYNVGKFAKLCMDNGHLDMLRGEEKDIWELYVINYSDWNSGDRIPMRINPNLDKNGWHRYYFDIFIKQYKH